MVETVEKEETNENNEIPEVKERPPCPTGIEQVESEKA